MATPDCSAGEINWFVVWCLWPDCVYQLACYTLNEALAAGWDHIDDFKHHGTADLWAPKFTVHMETHRWRRLMVR